MQLTHKFFMTLFIALAAGVISCNNPSTRAENESDKKAAEEKNDAKFDNKAENDAEFVVDAADMSLMEMNLGQLAQSRGTLKDTKDLGAMMNADHKKAYDELASLAAKKAITVPTAMSEASKKDYNDLNEKNGNDFDKKFCDMMVKGHKDAIDKFEKVEKNGADPDIKAWASKMLPALRHHLDASMTAQERAKAL